MITEDYVSFEVVQLLKEKGFDEETDYIFYHYEEDNDWCFEKFLLEDKFDNKKMLHCPTHQMVRKWLRKMYNININIVPIWNHNRFEYQVFVVAPENAKHCYIDDKLYLEYEEAVEAALKYSLENLI